jgi:hypothetical protein
MTLARGNKQVDWKKNRETFLARSFLESEALDARLAPGESPDFVLALADGRRVGLELTDLTDPIRAASTSAMDRFARTAETLLHRVPVAVAVSWHTGCVLAQHEVRQLAAELDRVVRAAVQRGAESVAAWEMEPGSLLPSRAERVVIWSTPGGPHVHASGETHWLFGDEQSMQAAISAKDLRVPIYRERLPTIPLWLLVVCASRHGDSNIPEMLDQAHVYATDFDRVAALDAGTRRVVWLRTHAG